MVANTNRHLPNVLPVTPALGDLNSPILIPPNILFKPNATIILPDGVHFYQIEVILHHDRIEEDGEDEE
tara:strand:- start:211 stop:417 length:207 start_codon:yes stop_codon:yes gene_type:complete